MRRISRVLSLAVLLIVCPVLAQAQQDSANEGAIRGSLSELRDKRRILLMVRRSEVVDASGQSKTILSEAYQPSTEPRGRFARIYNVLAQKLNKYMVKFQSISAARNISEAEFIVFFNLLEYRRPLGRPYPYGELFVILNDRAQGHEPRIIWKTRKSPIWAEDAVNEFIRDLKAARGEG
ncbi:MAG TPA: hypothetical protein VF779_04335 [Pyrinomonadaceae bacterium]